MGLLPVSDGNPMQFGHQREEGAASAPPTATLLSLGDAVCAAQRREREADAPTYPSARPYWRS
jgi:hypothetical protein